MTFTPQASFFRRFMGRLARLSVFAWMLPAALAPAAGALPLAPVALVADPAGQRLYIAEAAAKTIAVVDIASEKVVTQYPVPEVPGGLCLSPDGGTLYVSEAIPEGRVCALNLKADGALATQILPAGHTPQALAINAAGTTLYAANRFSHDISVIDLASGMESGRIAVPSEPAAIQLTGDGRLLLVANHLPERAMTTGDGATGNAAAVSVIDTAKGAVTATIRLANGATALQGIAIAPDGSQAYVTHILGRYATPTTQLERGWMNTNALSIIDLTSLGLVTTVLLDDVDHGAANPWAVTCTADGRYLCVSHAGSQEISVIDRPALLAKIKAIVAGQAVGAGAVSLAQIPDDLSFLNGVRRRVALAGNGPRALAVTGARLFAAEYFSDTLALVDLATTASAARALALGPVAPLSDERRGEMLFNDAALCFQQWQSCASCHPDGRADGLNWDLLNDGIGNPKNTKSLFLAHQTPPVMSLGVRDRAETAVRSGIKYIQFAQRPEADAAAIDTYLKSLKPVPSPYLQNGQLSAAAERGKVLFSQTGCLQCHNGPNLTDGQLHDLGLGTGPDAGKPFDTPTLVELWRTGPYLHDGRAATIQEVFSHDNPKDLHGRTAGLTASQLDDLAQYVLSQ